MTIAAPTIAAPVQATFRVAPMTPLKCKCGVTLGYTNGKRLVIGGVSFWRTTRFCCIVCRQDSTWIKGKAGAE